MRHFRFIPDKTNIPFVSFRYIAIALSIIMMVTSLILPFTWGINFGIEFSGGISIDAAWKGAGDPPVEKVRETLHQMGVEDFQIQRFGEKSILIRLSDTQIKRFHASSPSLQEREISSVAQEDTSSRKGRPVAVAASEVSNTASRLSAMIRDHLGDSFVFQRVDVVGPQVSSQLMRDGLLAVGIAIVLMLAYVWVRFEWQFGVGSVVALFHDVLLTIGVFSLFKFEFNLSTIAALLTIIGYSMNDTVVVFDRIRENLRRYRSMDLKELVNLSINETLSRTVMTSSTTLLSLLALLIFGGEAIRGFVFAMFFGIVVGTYSSIFIASPVVLAFGLPQGPSTKARQSSRKATSS